ncbi:unnamed protein product [Meganyctiphanes norvegica]|uniref:Uncharacterized protein n=1 Tax=Meganyctiphanes norvegica TaxID=48144 RepID=A0AAV2RKE0_MEGNR
MPPLNQLGSLSHIAFDYVWEWLSCLMKCTDDDDRQLQREYLLENLTTLFRQKLLDHCIKAHLWTIEAVQKSRFMDLLADDKTQSLNFTPCGTLMAEEVFGIYKSFVNYKIENLVFLGMKCSQEPGEQNFVKDINPAFYMVLPNMHKLRSVTLSGLADRTIMKLLAENCPYLEYLDVSGSDDINDNDVASLVVSGGKNIENMTDYNVLCFTAEATPCTKFLNNVDLSKTRVTIKSLIVLLRFAPKLKNLGETNGETSLSKALVAILSCEERHKFYLTHLSDINFQADDATFIKNRCSDLRSVSVDGESIPALHNLHPICLLRINLDFRNWGNDIYDYLNKRGMFITKLVFKNNINCVVDLGWIVAMTPNLQHLEANIDCFEGVQVADWKFLNNACVIVGSARSFQTFIRHAPNLHDLEINYNNKYTQPDWHCINDELLETVLIEGGLSKLKKFVIGQCALSIKSIECLFMQCFRISYIGYVRRWELLTREEIKNLKRKAIEENLKLTLREYSENEENILYT